MTHRRALIVSLFVTLITGIGLLVARDALVSSEPALDDPLVTVQMLEERQTPDDPWVSGGVAPGGFHEAEDQARDWDQDDAWEQTLISKHRERDDDHEDSWEHDDD
jgi:hypothetical protein